MRSLQTDSMNQNRSFRQILRSTAIFGGSSVINVLVGMVRVKLIAIMLGPVGVGLVGMYSMIMSTATGIAGLGMNYSGVRQVAAAQAANDEQAISDIWKALIKASIVFGILVMLGMCIMAQAISMSIFKDVSHAFAIRVLSVGTLFGVIAGTQTALLSGLRRVGDLARINVVGAILGTMISVLMIVVWGSKSIPYFIVTGVILTLLVSHLLIRKLSCPKLSSSLGQQWQQLKPMLRLGILNMLASQAIAGIAMIAARSIIIHYLGEDANGYFQAAYGISSIYISFILSSMSTDFYPRLTGVIHDRKAMNELIDQQLEMSIIIAMPIMLCLITFAPWILTLLYSSKFMSATVMLRWQLVGELLKLLSFPMKFIILSLGCGGLFFIVESAWCLIYLPLIFGGVIVNGIAATGFAYALTCLASFLSLIIISKRIAGFHWHRRSLHLVVISLCMVISLCCILHVNEISGVIAGTISATVFGLYSLRRLHGISKLSF